MNTLNPRVLLKVHIIVSLFLALAVPRLGEAGPSGSHSAVPPEARQKLAKLQIPFIANQGQSDKEMKFYARTFAGTVFVTEAGELVYSLPKVEGKERVKAVVLKEELIGGRVTEVKGEDQAITKLNYFKGNDRSKWQRNIPAYDVVSLGEVYEGVEVKLKAYGNNVEKLFYVKPGAKPETIKVRLSGRKEIKVNQNGELEVETKEGTVRFSKPVAFQEQAGKKEFVEAAYAIHGNEYGFKVADYDRARQLVIDPILAATFLGGSNEDHVRVVVPDSIGNVYVAGFTNSADFPGVGPGSPDSTLVFGEGFVARLNSDLSSILAASFLGGSLEERANALALDSVGNVYVAGGTISSDFPGIGPGSADNTFPEGNGGFVVKLNSDLNSILKATFLRGGAGTALALDSTGNVYVTGETVSSDFPGIGPGSADATFDGGREGFVAKLNSNLSSILAATFLGGNRNESPFALTLDATGNVYVAGFTGSSDFPGVGPGSADDAFAGGEVGDEGFVAKLNSDLSSILAATFVGGHSGDAVVALALDSTGNVYVAGVTRSFDFPGVGPGSAASAFVGPDEGFVAKLNSDLSSILAATFLGGSSLGGDLVSALALDGTGVYVGSAEGGENFVAKLRSDLSSILATIFLRLNSVFTLALDSGGNIYLAGETLDVFPGMGSASADGISRGLEGFVAKLDANLSLQIINDKVSFVVQSSSFNPAPVSGGPAGTFTIIAVLTNKSTQLIPEPIKAIVKTLTNGNKLLSATEGDGGVTSKQAIDARVHNSLFPNESATVQFRIGLANRSRFEFFVDVLGPVQ